MASSICRVCVDNKFNECIDNKWPFDSSETTNNNAEMAIDDGLSAFDLQLSLRLCLPCE